MASSDRELEVFSPQHGTDVSIVVFAVHVHTPTDGLGFDQIFVGVSLGKIDNNTIYSACHGREMTGLQPGLVRAEYLTGEAPQ